MKEGGIIAILNAKTVKIILDLLVINQVSKKLQLLVVSGIQTYIHQYVSQYLTQLLIES